MTNTTPAHGKVKGSVVVLDGPVLDPRVASLAPTADEVEFRRVLPPTPPSPSVNRASAAAGVRVSGIGLGVAFAAAKVGGPAILITSLGRAKAGELRPVAAGAGVGRQAHDDVVALFQARNSRGVLDWSATTAVGVSSGPVDGRREIELAETLVVTLNSPIETISAAIKIAAAAGTSVWLYASPNRYSSAELRQLPLALVNAVVANEDAARQLADLRPGSGSLVQRLKKVGGRVRLACVTNGTEGSHLAVRQTVAYISPATPRALEGVAADTFVGTFAHALTHGEASNIDDIRAKAIAASVAGGCSLEGSDNCLATASIPSYPSPIVRLVPNTPTLVLSQV